MHLDAAQRSLLPSAGDVAFYEEHGWFVTPVVLSAASLDRAAEAVARHYAGETTVDLAVTEGYARWRPEDGDTPLRNDEFISLRNHEIREFLYQPIIGAIAARLMRTPTVRLFDDQLIYKAPGDAEGSSVTGWHRDRAYWSTCSSGSMTTAWIPLHDVEATRAPLVYLDRSHTWEGFDHLRSFRDVDLAAFEQTVEERGYGIVKQWTTIRRGQVSFHHAGTIHASEANRSPHPRIAFAVHLQPEDNAYRPAAAPDGRPVVLPADRMCRKLPNGNPDYADPAMFPVLWTDR